MVLPSSLLASEGKKKKRDPIGPDDGVHLACLVTASPDHHHPATVSLLAIYPSLLSPPATITTSLPLCLPWLHAIPWVASMLSPSRSSSSL